MSLKRRHQDTAGAAQEDTDTDIYASSAIEDRASTFVAHFSPSLSAKKLQSHPDFKSASHCVAAWRKPSAQRSLRPEQLYDTGHDDDGESWAGKRLEKVLVDMKVEGAVVVARWYGGIMLGPVRFNHIENCAKEAIRKYLDMRSDGGKAQKPAIKKARVPEESRDKAALIQTLDERDQSIQVLRGLLKEKQGSNNGTKRPESSSAAEQPGQPSPTKPSYDGMAVEQLLRLEKARDATIGFLLKQIDAAEKNQPDGPAGESPPPATKVPPQAILTETG